VHNRSMATERRTAEIQEGRRRFATALRLCVAAIALLSGLAGCAGPAERRATARNIAGTGELGYRPIRTDRFTLASWVRTGEPGAPIDLYIAGDGLAWLDRDRPSPDPTPTDPVALRLAARDPSPNVAYLARPCQYTIETDRDACRPVYWTNGRFDEAVIEALDRAVGTLRREMGGGRLNLVGYSGGGALALLVAARRTDVTSVRTVAGLLDHRAWTALQKISPLDASRNPADIAARLAAVPQLHFLGGRDEIVPAAVAASYQDRMPADGCSRLRVVPGAGHEEGWAERWPELLAIPVPCRGDASHRSD